MARSGSRMAIARRRTTSDSLAQGPVQTGVAAGLKRAPGNQQLLRMQRRAATGGGPGTAPSVSAGAVPAPVDSSPLPTRLEISTPQEEHEQEADRVAEQVLRTPAEQPVRGQDHPHAVPAQGGHPASNEAASAVQATIQSSGQPLEPGLRAFMDSRFDNDFSTVRIHTDAQAEQSASAVNAQAYAIGNDIVFGAGQYSPGTREGRSLIAHELTHVLQQQGTQHRVMRQGPLLPRSLSSTLIPTALSLSELNREIAALDDWLAAQQAGTEETNRMFRVLEVLRAEKGVRIGVSNIGGPASRPHQPLLPPPSLGGASYPVNEPAATTTRVARPSSPTLNLTPNEGTRARLEQIIRTGGAMPAGTRVIGAAIVEVEGYRGSAELRSISSMQTDDLGHGASVSHAGTPATRTLSAARSIGGASLRGEFPFSHVNDAEIKLFEEIARHMPANARGRISFLTMRSRQDGRILEPIPACSSCTNATFQFSGSFRGVQVATYAAAHAAPSLELEGTRGTVAPTSSTGGASRPSGGSAATHSRSTTAGPTQAEVGTPDLRGLNVGGPSPRGEAIGAGITLAFMGADLLLNLANDHVQERRAREALNAIEPGMRSQRQQHPELGVLLEFSYTQFQAPPDSLIRPGAAFGSVNYYMGRTPDEALDARRATPMLRAGVGPYTTEFTQQVWIPPVIPPSVRDLRTPFRSVALATFVSERSALQDVEWGGITGFDDEGTSELSPGDVSPRFLILRVPNTLHFVNSGVRVAVDVSVAQRAAHSGGSIPVVNLDPTIPGFNVSAACVFPADDTTDRLFRRARETRDNLGQLAGYTNFGKVRWVRPENIRVLERL